MCKLLLRAMCTGMTGICPSAVMLPQETVGEPLAHQHAFARPTRVHCRSPSGTVVPTVVVLCGLGLELDGLPKTACLLVHGLLSQGLWSPGTQILPSAALRGASLLALFGSVRLEMMGEQCTCPAHAEGVLDI